MPLRRGVATLALLIATAVSGVATVAHDGQAPGEPITAPTSSVREDLVRMCLVLHEGRWVEQVVPCTAPHDAQIARVAERPEECPPGARDHITRSIRHELFYLCITDGPVRVHAS